MGRPLIHAPDATKPSVLVDALAARLAPRQRVLSVTPRPEVAYQVAAADLHGVLQQFGFLEPVLVGERLGCVPVLLVGAWHPEHVGGLVLVDPTRTPPSDGSLEARSLRDCPLDWEALRASLRCEVLEVHADEPTLLDRVESFVVGRLP